jgi:hypothetical protein
VAAGAVTERRRRCYATWPTSRPQSQDGSRTRPTLNASSTILRLLFERFELVHWPGFGGSGAGVATDHSPAVEDGLVLIRYDRAEAMDD